MREGPRRSQEGGGEGGPTTVGGGSCALSEMRASPIVWQIDLANMEFWQNENKMVFNGLAKVLGILMSLANDPLHVHICALLVTWHRGIWRGRLYLPHARPRLLFHRPQQTRAAAVLLRDLLPREEVGGGGRVGTRRRSRALPREPSQRRPS